MERLTATFEAWQVWRAGTREVIDAVVAPAHRGPSRELAGALAEWAGPHYWLDEARSQLLLVRPAPGERSERRWLVPLLLLALTVVCTLAAGAALAGAWAPRFGVGVEGTIAAVFAFGFDLANGGWRQLGAGWAFAIPMLTFLGVHELGHLHAARRHAIDTTLPYFLPIPPTLSPIGTLGAFLRLRSPVLDRRQLLDVGAAGPLAGFVVALVLLGWGYTISVPSTIAPEIHGAFITFAGRPVDLGDSLLTLGLRRLFFGNAQAVYLSLPAFAGWVGAFLTGLNLLPLSQLDGGHVLYGMLGRRQAAVGLVTVAVLLWLGHYWWTWYAWVVMSLLVGGGGWTHPAVLAPTRPVPPARRWIGWACIVVFALTFVPVPFRL